MIGDYEAAQSAINHAMKALRKRHLMEEGAHAPAYKALSRPYASESSEWKEKAENLGMELQQCYKAQARLSEQLVVEVAECRTLKASLQEKDAALNVLQDEIAFAREECSRLKDSLEEKVKALDLMISENQNLKLQLEESIMRAKNAEAENKVLLDRWLLQKMLDAERLNEANSMYEEMMDNLKSTSIQQLARQQVDGVIHRSEGINEKLMDFTVPSLCKHTLHAHEGGCGSIIFQYNSSKLVSGGQDQAVKQWDTVSGSFTGNLCGCLGSVLDLSMTHDNKYVIAATSSNNLYVWEIGSGRIRHTLTGHTNKVCAVDSSKVSSHLVASAAYDRTLKIWDLQKGYCTYTFISHSNCNGLCFSMDGLTICSGHVDGNLRFWDIRTGRQVSEIAAHSCAITSVCLSRSGVVVLTSGRDNVHNLFDTRTFEFCSALKAGGSVVASNWSRSCISPDDSHVAAGSTDGSVYVWSRLTTEIVSTLKGHSSPVLSCCWSGLGNSIASADKNGVICIWK